MSWILVLLALLLASPAAAQRGHFVENAGTPLTKRTMLNYNAPLQAADDGSETDISLDPVPDLATDAIDSLGEISDALCTTNQILEDQGASWVCINTPSGGTDTGPIPDCTGTELQDAAGTCVTNLTELNTSLGTGLVTGAHTADEVGAVTNTDICQGDGSLVQCNVATLSSLNTALGSSVADGAHTTDTGPTADCTGTELQDAAGTCVTNLAELNTSLSTGLVTGAHFTPTAGLSTDHGATSVGDTDIAAAAVDGGAAGEIADGTITSADTAASLETEVACAYVETPAVEVMESVWRAPVAVTITEIWCETDAGTVGLDLQNDDGTPTGVNGSDVSCAVANGTSDVSFAGDAALAQDHRLDIDINSVATAVKLSLCWRYTYD